MFTIFVILLIFLEVLRYSKAEVITTCCILSLAKSANRLLLGMEPASKCHDQKAEQKLLCEETNCSANLCQVNKENGKCGGVYELRQRNGVEKSENPSRQLNGKVTSSVLTQRKSCGSSRKRACNGLNSVHENRLSMRKSQVDRTGGLKMVCTRQSNGQSKQLNLKMANTVPTERETCGSSRKKSHNGLNALHDNGFSIRNLQLDSSRSPNCRIGGLKMVGNLGIVIEEPIGNPRTEGHAQASSINQSQDANYSYIPGLNDELALLCLAYTSRAEYHKLSSINKRYLALAQSGELYKIRREWGITEQWVYMLASDQSEWRAFDPFSRRWRTLPTLPSDSCFASSDKESLCAGTHLLVLGREIEGLVIWRYDLVTNKWYRGPAMLTPRCLYASASCNNFAFVAGGTSANGELLNSAERYDPDNQRWEPLPDMIKKRKLCSGCFMDGKFYVIGGTGDTGDLTCGEVYDSEKKSWQLIENMKPSGAKNLISQAPPLVAVANNELYALEPSMNQLKVYMKRTNEWKGLGEVPVRADLGSGWGVAFKSLGDELLLIGGGRDTYQNMYGCGISIYTSRPDSNGPEAVWQFLTRVGGPNGPFVFNCAIMAA